MVKIQFLGHSFFKISFPGSNVLIDPYFTPSLQDSAFNRIEECTAKGSWFKNVALILVSHEHFDHFDKKLIEEVANRDGCLVVSNESILQELDIPQNLKHAVMLGQKLTLRNVDIQAVAAHHPQAFYPLGFILSFKGNKIFHAGDTDLIDDFSNIKTDVALLPIGGTYTMDVVDAVRAVKTMKPKYAIPMHYNTFKMIKADPSEFKHKIEKSILKTKPVILKPGETFNLK